jgi:hypothetical protein
VIWPDRAIGYSEPGKDRPRRRRRVLRVPDSLSTVAARTALRWLTEQVRAGRLPAKKVAGYWRMTDQDIADAPDICANEIRCTTADVAIVTA